MKNEVVKKLELILANSYALALKTQNYHWNVTGNNFKQLHEMFGEQYENLSEAIDEIAERIRALGIKVDGSFENFSKLSKIKSGDKDLKTEAMLKDILSSNETLVKILNEGVISAQQNGDEVSAGMLSERLAYHQKTAWMIGATLQK